MQLPPEGTDAASQVSGAQAGHGDTCWVSSRLPLGPAVWIGDRSHRHFPVVLQTPRPNVAMPDARCLDGQHKPGASGLGRDPYLVHPPQIDEVIADSRRLVA